MMLKLDLEPGMQVSLWAAMIFLHYLISFSMALGSTLAAIFRYSKRTSTRWASTGVSDSGNGALYNSIVSTALVHCHDETAKINISNFPGSHFPAKGEEQ